MELSGWTDFLLICLGAGCLSAIFVAGFILLSLRLGYSTRKRIDEAWVKAAQQLGLAYTSQTLEEIKRADQAQNSSPTGLRRFLRVSSAPPPQLPGMAGNYRGLPVSIDTHSPRDGPDFTGTGDRYTRLTATISNLQGVRLEMRTSRSSSPYPNLRAEHCESGVEAIDRRFYTRCAPADFVKRWMPALTPYFSAIPGQYEVRIEDQTLIVSMMGLILKPDTLRAGLDLAVELNQALHG